MHNTELKRGKSMRYFFIFVFILVLSVSVTAQTMYEQYMSKGMSSLEKKDYNASEEAFRAALREKPDDYQAILFLGILLNKKGQKEAESLLKKALFLNPQDPETNLELGIYYYNKSIYPEARDYFENTIELAPNTTYSARANEYLSSIKRKGAKPWALDIAVGGQYDSNVVLNPTGGPLPEGITRKSDWRAVLSLRGRYSFIKGDKGDASVGYSFYQSLHAKLSDFNISQHIVDVRGLYNVSPSVQLKGIYSFEYVYVGGDDYDYVHTASPQLLISEGKGFSTIIEYQYRFYHFENSDLFLNNSDRTGPNNSIGITQNIPLHPSVLARVGYSHDVQAAKEAFWHYRGNKGTAGLVFLLPHKILLNLDGEYYSQRYRDIDPASGEKRKDKITTVAISITKALSDRYSITLGQLYTRNKSNLAAFDYERAITSLFLNARF